MHKRVDKRELIKENLDNLEDRVWQLLGINSTDTLWFEAIPALVEIRKELVLLKQEISNIAHIKPILTPMDSLIHNAGSSPAKSTLDKQPVQEPAFHSLQDTLPQGQ